MEYILGAIAVIAIIYLAFEYWGVTLILITIVFTQTGIH